MNEKNDDTQEGQALQPLVIDPNRGAETIESVGGTLTVERVLAALDDVKDPEIPVVSVVELGIVQRVEIETGGELDNEVETLDVPRVGDGSTTTDEPRVRVVITPTFSGCPALELMRQEITARVRALGAGRVEVPVELDPPWSSDRIAPEARERMKRIGLAPPPPAAGRFRSDDDLLLIQPRPSTAGHGLDATGGALETGAEDPIHCPFCGSEQTDLENAFGPTICRSLHYCRSCQQPFEQFKALG